MGQGRKNAFSMIAIDLVEPIELLGTGKRSKVDKEDEAIIQVLKESPKVKVVDATELYHPKK